MRGFVVGSMALIALEVLTRGGASRGVAEGGSALARILRRAMAPDVPLIPALAQRRPVATSAPAPRYSAAVQFT